MKNADSTLTNVGVSTQIKIMSVPTKIAANHYFVFRICHFCASIIREIMFRILKFEIEKGKMFSDVNNFWSRQFQEACLSMNGPAASQALSVSFFSSKVITYGKKKKLS